MDMPLDISELTDEQLAAAAAREGSDGPAFVALLQRFQERVWRICYRLLSNAEDANDASQEVFVRLFLARGKFEGRSKYSTWLHGIAVRTCLSLRRGRGRRRQHEAVAQQQQADKQQRAAAGDAPETALDLLRMLDILEDEDRALLILKYSAGHNYDELAEMFDLSVSACKMRISRASEKLRQRFPEHDFGAEKD
jgi:RNA polymerase sigma-70 factor (ECF subfamily)